MVRVREAGFGVTKSHSSKEKNKDLFDLESAKVYLIDEEPSVQGTFGHSPVVNALKPQIITQNAMK